MKNSNLLTLAFVIAFAAADHTPVIKSSFNHLAYYSEDSVSQFDVDAWTNVTALVTANSIAKFRDDQSLSWEDLTNAQVTTMANIGILTDEFKFRMADICFDGSVTVGQAVASQLENSEIANLLASTAAVESEVLNSWYSNGNCLAGEACPNNVVLTVTEFIQDDTSLVFQMTVVEMEVQGLSSTASILGSTTTQPITIRHVTTFTGISSPSILNTALLDQINDRLVTSSVGLSQVVAGPEVVVDEDYPDATVPSATLCSSDRNTNGAANSGNNDMDGSNNNDGSGAASMFSVASLASVLAWVALYTAM